MIVELAVIGGGFVAGWLLYKRFYTHASATESLLGVIFNLTWITAGIVSALTGFPVVGFVFLSLGTYWALSNQRDVRESDLRQQVANYDPPWID